jgi:hypothetical protein
MGYSAILCDANAFISRGQGLTDGTIEGPRTNGEGFERMKRGLSKLPCAAAGALAIALAWTACSSSKASLTCGAGTTQQGSTCVARLADASIESAASDSGLDGSAAAAPVFGGVTALAPVSPSALLAVWNPGTDANDPASPLSYRVYMAPSGAPLDYTKPAAYTWPGATSAVLGGLTAGITYVVGVRAVGTDNVEDTNTVTLMAAPAADTTPPTFDGASIGDHPGSGEIVLTWAPAQDDQSPPSAISYLVFMSVTPGGEDFTNPTLVTAPGATSAVIAHLAKATLPRYFVVLARDAAGNVSSKATSPEVASDPAADTQPPTFGGCSAAANVSAVTIAVSWQAATDDVSLPANIQYQVLASTTPGDVSTFKPIASVTGQTEVNVPSLNPSTAYYFICRARDEAGNEDQNTVEVSAQTGSNSTPPTFVTSLSITPEASPFAATIAWTPSATDDTTGANALVYDVYQSTTPGGENTSGPPQWSSAPGASSILLTGLLPDSMLYFVVCARDADGNHGCATGADGGTDEVMFQTPVSFAQNVEPIFNHNCGVVGCHVPGNPSGNLVLAKGFAYDAIVNVRASEATNVALKPDASLPADMDAGLTTLDSGASAVTLDYVVPGDPADSFLNIKTHVAALNALSAALSGQVGTSMPAPATGTTLSQAELDAIQTWIQQGAANN